MKALVFDRTGELEEILKLTELERPSISPTQALINVKARPVNPSDRFFARGVYRKKPAFPQIAGLEGSGTVVECGAEVSGFKPGDHVAFRGLNTWAEYCAVDQQSLIRVDEDIPFELSCQIGLNALSAFALLDELRLRKGDWLVLTAASSSLAGLVMQLATDMGVQVIPLVRDPEAMRKKANVEALPQDDPALAEIIQHVTRGAGVNGLLDAVGGKLVTAILPLMAQYGSIIAYGNYSNNEPATVTNGALVYKNLTIKGFGIDHWISCQPPERVRAIYRALIHQIAEGRLLLDPLPVITMADFVSGRPAAPKDVKWILI
jgi:NADPH:quinone reductase-like Zn-dependent oxidoreductase